MNRLLRVEMSLAVQVADELLFLGIDADDRVGRVPVFGTQSFDLAKLLIPLRMALGRQFLLRLASDEVGAVQQFRHRHDADPEAIAARVLADATQRQVSPTHSRTHRVASRVVMDEGGEGVAQTGEDLGRRGPPAPFFRARPGGKEKGSIISRLPRRMVFSSRSRTRAR